MTTATEKMIDLFRMARTRSVPIVAIATADQFATEAAVAGETNEKTPVVRWDAARGLTGVTTAGVALVRALVAKLADGEEADAADEDPSIGLRLPAALEALQKHAPRGTVAVVHNAHRQIESQEPGSVAENVQAIANTRDKFKLNLRMLVLLGPEVRVSAELEQDVFSLEHELPGPEELKELVADLHKEVKPKPLPVPKGRDMERAVDTVSGLSLFAAEQAISVSFTAGGLNMDTLGQRKRVQVEMTRGLSMITTKDTFGCLRGIEIAKARARQLINGKEPIGTVLWIDEGSDVFSSVDGGGNDQKMDQQRMLLVEMEQNHWPGMILVGPPGTGKSRFAETFCNEAGVPGLAADFGDTEEKWVGSSEANLRNMFRVAKRVGRGRVFVVLTCNSLRGIRPQLMRRFRRGTFFFDLPNAEEREAIWQYYLKLYGLDPEQPRPDDKGWAGAEIRECCDSAWNCGTTLVESAQFIVAVSQSRAKEIRDMRREAHGRFLDASRPGPYVYDAERSEAMEQVLRHIDLSGDPVQ